MDAPNTNETAAAVENLNGQGMVTQAPAGNAQTESTDDDGDGNGATVAMVTLGALIGALLIARFL